MISSTQIKKTWTREDTIIALNLYCKIPFNKVRDNHPEIQKFAKLLERKPSSIKMKIGNFGSFDQNLKDKGILGLSHASNLDKEVWSEFISNPEDFIFESESLIAKLEKKPINEIVEPDLEFVEGREKESIVKTRINQNFFRQLVISSYNERCCITNLNIPELLVASHIIPWSKDSKVRLNPSNGICLNALHDKAFDRGFLTITKDYRIKISPYIYDVYNTPAIEEFFTKYDSKEIVKPDRFIPDPEFLDYHNCYVFKG